MPTENTAHTPDASLEGAQDSLSEKGDISSEKTNTSAEADPKMSSKTPVKKGKPPLLIASIAIFALVVGVTTLLYILQYSVSRSLDTEHAAIAEIDSKISALRTDADVRSMELIHANKATIEHDIEASKAQVIITKLLELKKVYGVDFSGFSFNEKKVSTIVSVPSDPTDHEPANKLVRFISDFRNKTGSASGSILEMGDIRAVSGDASNRTFSVDFIVK